MYKYSRIFIILIHQRFHLTFLLYSFLLFPSLLNLGLVDIYLQYPCFLYVFSCRHMWPTFNASSELLNGKVLLGRDITWWFAITLWWKNYPNKEYVLFLLAAGIKTISQHTINYTRPLTQFTYFVKMFNSNSVQSIPLHQCF